MQVDLSKINQNEFFMRPCVIAGEPCVLVEPHGVGVAKWTKDNLHFRSSIWTTEGELVSAGFPKFFNWGEDIDKDGKQTDKIPYSKPKDLRDAEILDKLDGSLLIVSQFKNEMVIRTRGTISAEATLSNGDEIDFLREKYADFFARAEYITSNGVSLLCEWFSPRNKIVLNYGDEPQLWLVGAIIHDDYSLMGQAVLDEIAEETGIERPERYSFNSIAEMQAAVEALEGKEGVCLYYNGGQNILKLKSARYLSLHYYKGDVSTTDKLIDIWLKQNRPNYNDFYKYLSDTYDWEIAEYARQGCSKICDAYRTVNDIADGMKRFVAGLSGMPRKAQYEKVSASYGGAKNNRAGMVMNLLDGKELSDEQIKKLLLQNMK